MYTQTSCNIIFQDSPLNLTDGWNIFGYTCLEPIDVVAGLSQIEDQVIIVKDNEGNAYLPEWGFNGIGDLETGKGYQLKVNSSSILQY